MILPPPDCPAKGKKPFSPVWGMRLGGGDDSHRQGSLAPLLQRNFSTFAHVSGVFSGAAACGSRRAPASPIQRRREAVSMRKSKAISGKLAAPQLFWKNEALIYKGFGVI